MIVFVLSFKYILDKKIAQFIRILIMYDIEDVKEANMGLFFVWMLMSMIRTIPYKSWTHGVLMKYQEESL